MKNILLFIKDFELGSKVSSACVDAEMNVEFCDENTSPDDFVEESLLAIIDLDQDSFHVKVRISDDGCGIPKKDWKNIFRPGFSTKKSGWGLGLSLCQRIIKEVHKGKIYVLDSKINNGTVIELTIPNK